MKSKGVIDYITVIINRLCSSFVWIISVHVGDGAGDGDGGFDSL